MKASRLTQATFSVQTGVPESLVVSLPLNILLEASAPTLDALRQRAQALLTLPTGKSLQIV